MRMCFSLAFAVLWGTQGIAAQAPAAANSDPNYRQLRDAAPAETLAVERVSLIRDIGQIALRKGTVAFIPPVLGRTPIAVFVGEGEFRLAPALPMERDYLK